MKTLICLFSLFSSVSSHCRYNLIFQMCRYIATCGSSFAYFNLFFLLLFLLVTILNIYLLLFLAELLVM